MRWRSASELGQKYATKNYPSQGTQICKLHGPSIKPSHQSLLGKLQFICKAFPAGRPFLRWMYNMLQQRVRLPLGHHMRLSAGAQKDIKMWKKFFSTQPMRIPFLNFLHQQAPELELYTDASANPNLGFGCVFGTQWAWGRWPLDLFRSKNKPAINFLELFAIVMAIEIWAPQLATKRIQVFSDNTASVEILNAKFSKCNFCADLMRRLTLTSLSFQLYVTARHIPGKLNTKAGLLSRLKFREFHRKYPTMQSTPQPLAPSLWPLCWRTLTNSVRWVWDTQPAIATWTI